MNNSMEQPNYWQEFSDTLKERLKKPCKHPTFVMYFLTIVVLVGGFGVYEPLVSCFVFGATPTKDLPHAVVSASYTYFVAIAATAAVDLILSYYRKKFLLMFFLASSFAVIVLAIFSAAATYNRVIPVSAAIPTLLGMILALFLWWIGNADNMHLLDSQVEPAAAIGADSRKEPTGDLTGFNT